MSSSRAKWLRRIWREAITTEKELLQQTVRAAVMRRRLWKDMKRAYKPGMRKADVLRNTFARAW